MKKIFIILLFLIISLQLISANSIITDSLEAQQINVDINKSYMRFYNDYLDLSLEHIDFFLPTELQDELAVVTACDPNLMECQGPDGKFHILNDWTNEFSDKFYLEIDFLFDYEKEHWNPDNDIPEGFGWKRINQEILVNHNKQNIGLGEILETGISVGTDKKILINLYSHYEILIIDYYFVFSPSSFVDSNDLVVIASYQNVFLGEKPELLKIKGLKNRSKNGYDEFFGVLDNSYRDAYVGYVTIAYPKEKTLMGYDFGNSIEVSNRYSDVVVKANNLGKTDLLVDNVNDFVFKSFLINVPANSVSRYNFRVNSSSGELNEGYMWFEGSWAALKVLLGDNNLLEDLNSYYKLDETSGSTVNDELNSRDGASANMDINKVGKINTAYRLINNASTINFGAYTQGAFTWNIWIRYDESRQFTNQLLVHRSTKEIVFSYRTWGDDTGVTRPSFHVGGAGIIAPDLGESSSDWFMLTGTWDGTTDTNSISFYVNGELVGEATAGTTGGTTSHLALGYASWVGNKNSDVTVDEFGMWDRVLSSEEIQVLYKNGDAFAYPFEFPKARILWNVYKESTSIDLNGVNVDCNVNDMNVLNQDSPFYSNYVVQDTSFSCIFSKIGYDNNTITGIVDSNKSLTVYLSEADTNAPITTLSGCIAGWKNSNQTITLLCDDGTGSGCDVTRYKLNDGAYQVYFVPFILSTDANHKIEYDSNDLAGNIETTKTSYCAIDKTNPILHTFVPLNNSLEVYSNLISFDYNELYPDNNIIVNINGGITDFNQLLHCSNVSNELYRCSWVETNLITNHVNIIDINVYNDLNQSSTATVSFEYLGAGTGGGGGTTTPTTTKSFKIINPIEDKIFINYALNKATTQKFVLFNDGETDLTINLQTTNTMHEFYSFRTDWDGKLLAGETREVEVSFLIIKDVGLNDFNFIFSNNDIIINKQIILKQGVFLKDNFKDVIEILNFDLTQGFLLWHLLAIMFFGGALFSGLKLSGDKKILGVSVSVILLVVLLLLVL